MHCLHRLDFFFFFNDTATTEIYTLSLHDALPISIRQQIVTLLTASLREEEKADAEVRKKITSQKKEILEGSEEWDVLYRKYYTEEMRRMGVQTAPEEHRRPQGNY